MMSAPSSTRSSSAASSSRSSGPTRPPKEPLMPVSWESIANDHILGIAPYEPGKPIEELEREFGLTDVIKLASNENPLPPSERVLKAIADALPHLNRYPDGSAHYLRIALARRHGLNPDQLIMGNGSNELIELIVRAFLRPGEEAVIPHPSFVVYPMIVQAAGGIRVVVTLKDHRLDLEAMARAITPMTKLVFVANPNNPTATVVTAEEVTTFMARVPDKVIVVFDEAYFEFAQDPGFSAALSRRRRGRSRSRGRSWRSAGGSGVSSPPSPTEPWTGSPPISPRAWRAPISSSSPPRWPPWRRSFPRSGAPPPTALSSRTWAAPRRASSAPPRPWPRSAPSPSWAGIPSPAPISQAMAWRGPISSAAPSSSSPRPSAPASTRSSARASSGKPWAAGS